MPQWAGAHKIMSSIGSVTSSQSNAVCQYQEYLQRLKMIKAVADAPTDTVKGTAAEQQQPQVDADKDGD